MKHWPQQHRNLAAFILLVASAAIVVYFLTIRPKARDVEQARENLRDLRNKLEQTGHPLDSERLGRLVDECRRSLEGPTTDPGTADLRTVAGIKPKAEAVLKMATTMFEPKIKEFFGSPADFVREVSRLDYQEEFNQLERRLRTHDIILAEEVLGIGENTPSDRIYRLLLQVWTVDMVVNLVLDNNLSIARDADAFIVTETGRRQASRISVQPVQDYYMSAEDKQPYVMELPVRVTVRGELQDVCNLLRAVHTADRFFPVNHLEMVSEVPAGNAAKGEVRVGRVVANLQLSAFFRVGDHTPLPQRKTEKILPRGA